MKPIKECKLEYMEKNLFHIYGKTFENWSKKLQFQLANSFRPEYFIFRLMDDKIVCVKCNLLPISYSIVLEFLPVVYLDDLNLDDIKNGYLPKEFMPYFTHILESLPEINWDSDFDKTYRFIYELYLISKSN